MSNKKNIDRLFQEKFKDFEATPNDSVWKGIEVKLQNKEKKKRRIVPFWWTIGGAAAAILLLFAIGNLVFTNTSNPSSVVDNDKTEINEKKDPNSKQQDTSIVSQNNDSSEAYDENKNDTSSSTDKTKNSLLKSKTEHQNNNAIVFQNPKNNNIVKEKKNQNISKSNNTQHYIVKNEKHNNSNIDNKTVIESKSKTNAVAFNKNNNSNSTQLNSKAQLKSNEEIKALLNESNEKTDNAVAKSEKSDSSNKTKNENSTNEKTLSIGNQTEIKKQSIEDAIAEANTENEKEEDKKRRRWSIAPNVAPVYFNSSGKGSALDAQFVENNRSSNVTMSYGVKGSYAINDRLKITTGINQVNFNSTTNNVIALSNNDFPSRVTVQGISSEQLATNNSTLGNVQLNSSNSNNGLVLLSRANPNKSIPEAISASRAGDLNQNFGFIEIPLEVDYRLIDKKLGVNLSGGFSTFLLNENEIFADVDGQNTRIGKANNINDTSFSANFGVGLDYNISKKVNINLEPKFKYQLNTFKNTSGNFRPFFIGVYTGLSFKF